MSKNIKKLIGIILAAAVVLGVGVSTFVKSNKDKTKEVLKETKVNKEKIKIPESVCIRYAFADVDFDQIIQDVDLKDNDEKADYIFMRFSNTILPTKVQNSILDIKNYKLDGKIIPTSSKVYIDKRGVQSLVILKLPNKILKNKNGGHVLEIDKKININGKTKIVGDFKLNLPYSNKNTVVNQSNINDKTNNKNIKDKNISEKKNNIIKDSKIPKYSIELGKGLPLATVVLVKLDIKDPSNYNVFVGDEKLDMRKNKQGINVFVKGIKKDYSYDDVESRLKIVKIKK